MATRLNRNRFVVWAAVLLLAVGTAAAQVATSGRLTGLVTDATQASVPGANVTIADESTGTTITTQTGADGSFSVGNLKPANYTVRVSSQGFKTQEYRNVKIEVGATYTLNATLEVGEVQSTVVVEAGAEVLKTSETAVATTITGKAIQQLPFTSRDALDLGVLMPGAQTTGRPRATSFMGLPKGSINITYDGINAQDNINKSSDGFFTTIRPRVDSIEEFSINTSVGGAEQTGEGAVQIRFESKRGGNEYHGSTWWYHRNDFLNANYYFNNLAGTPRARQRLNQFGYSVGGPIIKDKLFFFHAFDFYRKPESRARQRSILTPEAASGIYRYRTSTDFVVPGGGLASHLNCGPSATPGATVSSGTECTADVLALAANGGLSSTIDPVLGPLVQALAGLPSTPGVGLLPAPNLFQNAINFSNPGRGNRYFPDFRFDWNVTNNHQVSAIYHYSKFVSTPDFLNSRDFTYPVAPFNTNQASQNSDRNQMTGQWRWNMAANKSNMFIFGVVSAPVAFFNDMDPSIYPQFTTNLGAIRVRPRIFGFSTAPWLPFGAFPRNTALAQMSDTFSWTRGKHSMNFGFSATSVYGGIQSSDSAVASLRMDGIANSDPAISVFSSSAFPGNSTTGNRNNARGLYATLTGRVGRSGSGRETYDGFAYVDLKTRQFVTGAPLFENYRQNEFGFFGTDSWRVTPTLTFNYGLRWEYQGSPYGTDNIYFNLVGGEVGVFGVSGNNNLFAPGTLTGSPTVYELNGNTGWYDRDLNNFAPSVGLAWNPALDAGWYKFLFGGPNRTVFRAGYSVSYTREGTANWLSITESNPGFFSDQTARPGNFTAGSVFFSGGTINGVQADPPAFVDTFPLGAFSSSGVNAIANNLRTPYVQSWSFGIQREITPSTVVEIRYEGNHAPNLWRQQDFNEVNIFENGFLNEYLAAQNNLAICRNNAATCTSNQLAGGVASGDETADNFGNWGLAGQVSLPTITAAFTGSIIGSQADSGFVNGAVGDLDTNQAGSFGETLAFSFPDNIVLAGLPANHFLVNPDALGGAFMLRNGARSTYHGLVVEVRRRISKGLQFNANYVWSKSLTNLFAVSGANFDQTDTLRDFGRDKGPAPFDIRHALKFQGIYELPFGPGRRWSSEHAWMNRIIEGWELSFLGRLQSGRVTRLTGGIGGTFNGNDGGIEFVGITPKQLAKMAKVRRLPTGEVFFFPANLIDSDGTSNDAMIRPCQTPGQFCQRAFVHGPFFFKPDINVVKNTRITEGVSIQFRAEFLNAFNTVNFLYGGTAAAGTAQDSISSTSFGRIDDAYQDTSTTDDPGGRIIQFVLRVRF